MTRSDVVRTRLSGGLEHLGDDLGVGLAVEPHLTQSRGVAHILPDGRNDGATPGARGQQDGAVDIDVQRGARSLGGRSRWSQVEIIWSS